MSSIYPASGPVAVFGGTFDPVHYGHLRSALELVEALRLSALALMPAASPPHRDAPQRSAEARARMVERAVTGEAQLLCDRRELSREGPSYTVDSLAELRQELGAERSLSMVIGCDALLGLPTWHRWDTLLSLAHIVVLARPGWELPAGNALAQWLAEHRLARPEAVGQAPCGGVAVLQLRPLAISSTEIRTLLGQGRSARYLTPNPVLDYIEEHGLYRD